jgi:hypothetical protein
LSLHTQAAQGHLKANAGPCKTCARARSNCTQLSVRPTDGGWVLNFNHAFALLFYWKGGTSIILHHFDYKAPYKLKRDFSEMGYHSSSADVSCPASIATCQLFSAWYDGRENWCCRWRGAYQADDSAVLTSLGVHVHLRQVVSLDKYRRQGPWSFRAHVFRLFFWNNIRLSLNCSRRTDVPNIYFS